jgi:hypothetical protein
MDAIITVRKLDDVTTSRRKQQYRSTWDCCSVPCINFSLYSIEIVSAHEFS